ncbi:MAG: hypothetical protein Q9M14_02460, partial [Mariprofundaceae bacterium]|nr:hypothetical protein [Mariprofundaceae bacterium]
MARFRSAKSEAAHAVAQLDGIGIPRHGNKKDGKIHSFRTSDAYSQAIKNYIQWRIFNGFFDGLSGLTPLLASAFLEERSDEIVQSHLDVERRALALILSVKLKQVKSKVENQTKQKCYTAQQVALVTDHQSEKNNFSTRLSGATGVRAHELLTLKYPREQPKSDHRAWSNLRFKGLDTGVIMTVCGKGGLIREIFVPELLHAQLMSQFLSKQPKKVTDRKITYITNFEIGGGQSWSQSFSSASKRVLGWSCGAHSLRHEYARSRMETMQKLGLSYFDARK